MTFNVYFYAPPDRGPVTKARQKNCPEASGNQSVTVTVHFSRFKMVASGEKRAYRGGRIIATVTELLFEACWT
jgi:hypothetical protein